MRYNLLILLVLLTHNPLSAQVSNCRWVSIEEKQSFFKKGPQSFISGIRVLPKFKEGGEKEKPKFLGFAIDQILSQSVLLNGPLNIGDIIISVNGEPIGRPEHFMKTWEVAKKANKIDVEILRDGEKITISWCVKPTEAK
jgi:type II secretory pathway component PulC